MDRWEYGHDAYSGTIGQKSGVVQILTTGKMPRKGTRGNGYPPDHERYHEFSVSSWSVLDSLIATAELNWSDEWDGKLPAKAKKARKRLEQFIRPSEWRLLARHTSDKWGDPAAIQLTGTALREAKEKLGIARSHEKVWLVIGWAAC